MMSLGGNRNRYTSAAVSAALILAMIMPLLVVPYHAARGQEPLDTLPVEGSPDILFEATQGEAGAPVSVTGTGSCFAQAGAAVAGAAATAPTGIPTSDTATRAGVLLTAGGTVLTCIGTFLSLVKNTITAGGVTYLVSKSKLDVAATAALKVAIRIVRDMVIRWIITGRFEAPVFSASFSIDAAKAAENASRIFLSQLTDINFCKAITPPSIRDFRLDIEFGLSCTLPGEIDKNRADYLLTALYNPQQLALDYPRQGQINFGDASNDKIYTFTEILRQRDSAIARALVAQSAEYVAGLGFLGIRDPKTGKITTPGSAVAELVMQLRIVSPIRQTDVANTTQQAIAAIIDTAVRVLIEKGLGQVFGP